MCRSRSDGGRRCPACTDPARLALRRTRQRLTCAKARAAEFTPAATVEHADEQLLVVFGQIHHDPAAQDQILQTLQARDDAELAAEREREHQFGREPDLLDQVPVEPDPLHRPSHRLATRRITAAQRQTTGEAAPA